MRSLLLLLALTTPAMAQKKASKFADVADVTASIEPAKAQPGQTVTFTLTVIPKPDCWTYANSSGKQLFKLPKTGDVVFSQKIEDPPGAEDKFENGKVIPTYTAPAIATWTFTGRVSESAAPGKKTIALTGTKLQACNEQNCFPSDPTNPPSAELEILPGNITPPPAPVQPRANPPEPVSSPATSPSAPKVEPTAPAHKGVVKKNAVSPSQHKAALDELAKRIPTDTVPSQAPSSTNLWAFITTAAAWGWISLVTPCVFPMIPITVSLFLKQGNRSPRQVLKLAAAYSLTIIAVLTVAAYFALKTFQSLSVNPWMNIGLGVLLVVFALSLFGMFDIALPGFLLRYTEKRRGSGGMVGTVFGALAFSIVSFTCVAPFLGGFAGMVASNQYEGWFLISGALAFATAFASPFFVLALFPTLIKKLPKSGGWLDTIKAVMGFVEVAAALKFFRTAELRLLSPTEYFTYDLCLTGIVVVSAACGLYLLNVFRLPHDEERPNIGVGRLMWAMGFLGLAVYLTPGLLKTADGKSQRPGGIVYAWVEAFLLPEPVEGLPWDSDLNHAIEAARQSTDGRRLVFVDFTGKTCQNCKLNENNVFPRPEVDELLRKYQLAQLYTDEVPTEFYAVPPSLDDRNDEATANQLFQRDVFKDQKLPLYAILEPQPDGKVRVVSVYDEGKINDPARFAAFLKKPLGK